MIAIAHIKTPLGIAKLEGDEQGLQAVTVLNNEFETQYDEIPESLQDAVEQLTAYFTGERREFDLVLNPQGTQFQKRVWNKLLEIPFGKTVTYMDIAKRLGDIKVIRAAASANGKNPLSIIVPCHRVIGSDGSLTGYAGGLWRKKWLLEHESPVIQQKLF